MAKQKQSSIESVYESFTSLDESSQVNTFKLIQQFLQDQVTLHQEKIRLASQSVELLEQVVNDKK